MANIIISFFERNEELGCDIWFSVAVVMCCSKKSFFIYSSVLKDCSDFRFSVIFDISFLDVVSQLVLDCNCAVCNKSYVARMLNMIIYFSDLDGTNGQLPMKQGKV